MLLVLLLELRGGPDALLHTVAATLAIGRVVHAYGVSRSPENYGHRVAGMALTFAALGGSALALLIDLTGSVAA